MHGMDLRKEIKNLKQNLQKQTGSKLIYTIHAYNPQLRNLQFEKHELKRKIKFHWSRILKRKENYNNILLSMFLV